MRDEGFTKWRELGNGNTRNTTRMEKGENVAQGPTKQRELGNRNIRKKQQKGIFELTSIEVSQEIGIPGTQQERNNWRKKG